MFETIINSVNFKSFCQIECITIDQMDYCISFYCGKHNIQRIIYDVDGLLSAIDEIYELDGDMLGCNLFVEMIFNM